MLTIFFRTDINIQMLSFCANGVQNMNTKHSHNADTAALHKRIQDLENQIKIYEDEHRALEALDEFKGNELKEAKTIIQTQEKLAQLFNEELIEKDTFLKAKQNVLEASSDSLKENAETFKQILDINTKISSLLDTKDLLPAILQIMIDSLGAKRGVLFIFDKSFCHTPITHNISESEFRKKSKGSIQSYIDEVFLTKKHLLSNQSSENKNTVSFLCTPLIHCEEIKGVVYLDSDEPGFVFSSNKLRIANIYCSQAAISLDNSLLYQRIKEKNHSLLRLSNILSSLIEIINGEVREQAVKIGSLIKNISDGAATKGEAQITWKSFNNIYNRMCRAIERASEIEALEKEADELFKDNVDFNSVFKTIFDHIKSDVQTKDLNVTIDLPISFSGYQGNFVILRTIFEELVSNAVLYNKDNGKIIITGTDEKEFLRFEISDTGHGIKGNDLPRIYEQFFRTESSSELNSRGAGLGLYMVKNFLQYYQGSIEVKSIYGVGSSFVIRIMK